MTLRCIEFNKMRMGCNTGHVNNYTFSVVGYNYDSKRDQYKQISRHRCTLSDSVQYNGDCKNLVVSVYDTDSAFLIGTCSIPVSAMNGGNYNTYVVKSNYDGTSCISSRNNPFNRGTLNYSLSEVAEAGLPTSDMPTSGMLTSKHNSTTYCVKDSTGLMDVFFARRNVICQIDLESSGKKIEGQLTCIYNMCQQNQIPGNNQLVYLNEICDVSGISPNQFFKLLMCSQNHTFDSTAVENFKNVGIALTRVLDEFKVTLRRAFRRWRLQNVATSEGYTSPSERVPFSVNSHWNAVRLASLVIRYEADHNWKGSGSEEFTDILGATCICKGCNVNTRCPVNRCIRRTYGDCEDSAIYALQIHKALSKNNPALEDYTMAILTCGVKMSDVNNHSTAQAGCLETHTCAMAFSKQRLRSMISRGNAFLKSCHSSKENCNVLKMAHFEPCSLYEDYEGQDCPCGKMWPLEGTGWLVCHTQSGIVDQTRKQRSLDFVQNFVAHCPHKFDFAVPTPVDKIHFYHTIYTMYVDGVKLRAYTVNHDISNGIDHLKFILDKDYHNHVILLQEAETFTKQELQDMQNMFSFLYPNNHINATESVDRTSLKYLLKENLVSGGFVLRGNTDTTNANFDHMIPSPYNPVIQRIPLCSGFDICLVI